MGYSLWGLKESDTTEQLTFSLYGDTIHISNNSLIENIQLTAF